MFETNDTTANKAYLAGASTSLFLLRWIQTEIKSKVDIRYKISDKMPYTSEGSTFDLGFVRFGLSMRKLVGVE